MLHYKRWRCADFVLIFTERMIVVNLFLDILIAERILKRCHVAIWCDLLENVHEFLSAFATTCVNPSCTCGIHSTQHFPEVTLHASTFASCRCGARILVILQRKTTESKGYAVFVFLINLIYGFHCGCTTRALQIRILH